jgi:hypothetical protein
LSKVPEAAIAFRIIKIAFRIIKIAATTLGGGGH